MDTERRQISLFQHNPDTQKVTQEEVLDLKDAFTKKDVKFTGVVNLRDALGIVNSIGYNIGEEEFSALLVAYVGHSTSKSGDIDFPTILQLLLKYKRKTYENENELVDAFVAAGGNIDKTGGVSVTKLETVVQQFGLKLALQEIWDLADHDGNVSFANFAKVFENFSVV